MSQYGNVTEMHDMEGPHERLHRIVKDIVTLKTQGDSAGAEARFQEIEPLSKEIVGYRDRIEGKVKQL